jgi:hypothetical protein
MTAVIVLAAALVLLEFRASQGNVGVTFNGLGATDGALNRSSHAPMRYRVLVPWLLWPFSRLVRLRVYVIIKALLIFFSLVAVRPLVSDLGLAVFAIALTLTFEFDYWDCYVEVIAVCLLLTGEPVYALIGTTLWALSKETVLIAPVVGFFAGGPMVALASLPGLLVWWLMHKRQGKASLYYPRWEARWQRLRAWRNAKDKPALPIYWAIGLAIVLIGVYNPADLKMAPKRRDAGPFISVLYTLFVVIVALLNRDPALSGTIWLALVWPLAGWTLVRARETRVMLPSAIWLAMALS